jgi:hypothetical protein
MFPNENSAALFVRNILRLKIYKRSMFRHREEKVTFVIGGSLISSRICRLHIRIVSLSYIQHTTPRESVCVSMCDADVIKLGGARTPQVEREGR